MGDLKFQDITPASGKIKLGSTDVDAIYSGSTKVWPSDVSFGDIFFEATGTTVQQAGQYTLWYATDSYTSPPGPTDPTWDPAVAPYYPTTATFPDLSEWTQIDGVRSFGSCPDFNPFDIAVPLELNTSYFFQVRSLDGSLLYKFNPEIYNSPAPPVTACSTFPTAVYTYRLNTADISNTRYITGAITSDDTVPGPGDPKVQIQASVDPSRDVDANGYDLFVFQSTDPNDTPTFTISSASANLLACPNIVNFPSVTVTTTPGNNSTIYWRYQIKDSSSDIIPIAIKSNVCSNLDSYAEYKTITVSTPLENNNTLVSNVILQPEVAVPTVEFCEREWTAVNADTSIDDVGNTIPLASNTSEWNNYCDQGLPCRAYKNFDISNQSLGALYNVFARDAIAVPSDGGNTWRIPNNSTPDFDFEKIRTQKASVSGCEFSDKTNSTAAKPGAWNPTPSSTTYWGASGLDIQGYGIFNGANGGSFQFEGQAEYIWLQNARNIGVFQLSNNISVYPGSASFDDRTGCFIRFVRDL